jgi:ComF family protein
VIRRMFDWLFPRCCRVCRAEIPADAVFCAKCFSEIIFIDAPICSRCGKMLPVPLPSEDSQLCPVCSGNDEICFDVSRSLLLYNNFSRRIIFQVKRKADVGVVRDCVRMLAMRYNQIINTADLIIPVPSHWSRNLIRGYNPPSLIARELSKLFDIPTDDWCLKRIRRTEYQGNKTVAERVANVKSAFSCDRRDLMDKRILLVDDVRTTGATLNECSKSLKAAGASLVSCITLASTSIEGERV